MPLLEPSFTLYAMERRGRGSSGDAETYSGEREFEDVAAVVDGIGGPVDVVAHSWGAACALEAARLTPNVARLVLYDPTVISTRIAPYTLADELDALIAQAGSARRGAWLILPASAAHACGCAPAIASRPGLDKQFGVRTHHTERDARSRSDVSFRLEHGSRNRPAHAVAPGRAQSSRHASSSAALHAVLPGSRLVTLQGQGHGALRTAPRIVASHVGDFLATHAT